MNEKRGHIITEEHIGKVLSVKDFRTMPERIFPLHVLYLMALIDKEKEEKFMVFEIDKRNPVAKGGRIYGYG